LRFFVGAHALEDLEPLGIEFLEKVQESGFVSEDVMSMRRAKDYLYGYVHLLFFVFAQK